MLLLAGLLLPGSASVYAQALRGVVTEAETGQPIVGAIVILKGSTTHAITDEEGNYTIKDIAAGRYNVEAKVLGFASMEVQEVLIAGNKEVIVNFALNEITKTLGEIVVRPTVTKEKAVNPWALVGARMLSMEEASRYAGGYSDPRLPALQAAPTTTASPCTAMPRRASRGAWRALKSTAPTTSPMPLAWAQALSAP